MQDLTITLIQSALHWQNKAANFEKNERIFETLGKTDLVILPEMFTTGFTMQPEQLAEDFPGESVDWMATQARRLNAVITGSIAVRESGHYYNRLIWMRPSGEYETYDKRHLFRMAGEDKHYSAGQKRL
ncbi:MAG TPA: nitrilase family protein, partial [Gammaproteobacteria bacterium]|nr:nitrilase family protein [Gammaproteobacteria bacterium]